MRHGNITISSGGTIVPIDSMRTLSNKSGGHTGAHLAEKFLQDGYNVQYVRTGHGVLPFLYPFQKNPIESKDVVSSIQEIQQHIQGETLEIVDVPYFDDYKDAMVSISKNSQLGDAAIIAAAVSDYGMKKVYDGKISSQQEDISLDLQRLPKVINLMREVSSKLVMIGFKLLPVEGSQKETYDSLIGASLKQMHGLSETDLVVANSSSSKPNSRGIGIEDTLIVSPDGTYERIDRENLFETIQERIPDLVTKRKENIS